MIANCKACVLHLFSLKMVEDGKASSTDFYFEKFSIFTRKCKQAISRLAKNMKGFKFFLMFFLKTVGIL